MSSDSSGSAGAREARDEILSAAFRREREASWRALAKLVEQAESGGIRGFSAEDLAKLPALYRAAVSSLGVARAVCLDRSLLEFLEALVQRAYFVVYGPKRRALEVIDDFVGRVFPSIVRRSWRKILVAFACLFAGVMTSFVLCSRDMDLYGSFVDVGQAAGRDPDATTDYLRSTLYSEGEGLSEYLVLFASFLFTHNAMVGLLAFSLGFLAGVPVIILLFINGVQLGAMSALFHERSLGADWWSWILPHGITELTAVVFCGAGGLLLGDGLISPGRFRRLVNLAERGREAGVLVMGAIMMLFIAGGIEGIFRQSVHDLGVRYTVATLTALLWTGYFVFAGRRRVP